MAIQMEMTPIRASSWKLQEQDEDQDQDQPQQHHQHQQPPTNRIPRQRNRRLSLSEATCDVAWERQRRQSLRERRKKNGNNNKHANHSSICLTDEDMKDLKGCIELGFGFNEEKMEENGPKHRLRHALPALDLYFAVNRQSFSRSPIMSPSENRENNMVEGCGTDDDQWKLCNADDSPQQVKTKLRHWAQAVACSVRQTSS